MPAKILFVCTGLGRVSRGYESFTRECFSELKDAPGFTFLLFKGGGENNRDEKKIFNFHRTGGIAKLLSAIFKSKDAYYFEQLSFFFAMLPRLLRFKPDVILFSDFYLGTFLWHFREKLGLKYKLLFSNGAPNGPPFKCADHVQQLLKYHYDIAIKGGENPSKHEILPYGIEMDKQRALLNTSKVELLKKSLKIPLNRKIILCVGAINNDHKRMDYLIREFASLTNKNAFLIILGQFTEQSEEVLQLAKSILNPDKFLITSVPHEQVKNFYQASDIFVLASLQEGLPRVILEAASYGLPVICHDYGINRETLEDFGIYINMAEKGELSRALAQFIEDKLIEISVKNRMEFIYNHYSWDVLKIKYLQMIRNCL